MTFTRARDLAAIGLVAAVACYLALRAFYGDLPPLPIFAAVMLGVLAVVEFSLGFPLRSRVRSGDRAIQPLTYARAVALAKASSILGSLMFGAWLATLAFLIPERDRISAAVDDVPAAATGVVCSAALIGAALWLESCCRTPRDPDDQGNRDIDQKV